MAHRRFRHGIPYIKNASGAGRKLILYDERVIFIIVYRFYCPETKKTYSLLPFFIRRYERHINTVIEDALKNNFIEGVSAETLAEEPSPSPWTIRRWLKKFQSSLNAGL